MEHRKNFKIGLIPEAIRKVEWEVIPYSFVQINDYVFDEDYGWLEFCRYPPYTTEELDRSIPS